MKVIKNHQPLLPMSCKRRTETANVYLPCFGFLKAGFDFFLKKDYLIFAYLRFKNKL